MSCKLREKHRHVIGLRLQALVVADRWVVLVFTLVHLVVLSNLVIILMIQLRIYFSIFEICFLNLFFVWSLTFRFVALGLYKVLCYLWPPCYFIAIIFCTCFCFFYQRLTFIYASKKLVFNLQILILSRISSAYLVGIWISCKGLIFLRDFFILDVF